MTVLATSMTDILKAGGGLRIYSKSILANTLRDLAATARSSGAHLTIVVNATLLAHSMVEIAKAGAGHVTFDLTESQ